MAEDRDQWADTLSAQHTGGWLTSFLAEEDTLDRRTLWRLGSWGVGAVAAVVVAVLASQSQMQLRREQVASADVLARQSQQIQFVTRETQAESRRLSQAIETLNGDRDRLYTRVTSVEQGLESVTGSIKRQTVAAAPPTVAAAPVPVPAPPPAVATVEPAPAPQAAAPPPSVAAPAPLIGPVASAAPVAEPASPAKPGAIMAAPMPASAPLMTSKSIMAPPDPAATRLSEPVAEPAPEVVAAVQPAAPEPAAAEPPAVAVPRTEFGIDLGGANSVDGLRALWRSIAKSNKALAGLRPIIMVKERSTGLGMQLRLVLGPLSDAATAAKICAIMTESNRPCETSMFDGQRLAVKTDAAPAEAAAPAKPPAAQRKRAPVRNERTERVAPPPAAVEEPAPPPKPQSSLTSFLGIR